MTGFPSRVDLDDDDESLVVTLTLSAGPTLPLELVLYGIVHHQETWTHGSERALFGWCCFWQAGSPVELTAVDAQSLRPVSTLPLESGLIPAF